MAHRTTTLKGSVVTQHSMPMWRLLWLIAGALALALSAVGVFLPILPTTPFVILAAFAFGKASPRLEAWLVNSRLFGQIIADWRANGAIAPRYKMIALVMMGSVLALSLWMQVSAMVLVIQLVCIGPASAFILSRPSSPTEDF